MYTYRNLSGVWFGPKSIFFSFIMPVLGITRARNTQASLFHLVVNEINDFLENLFYILQ